MFLKENHEMSKLVKTGSKSKRNFVDFSSKNSSLISQSSSDSEDTYKHNHLELKECLKKTAIRRKVSCRYDYTNIILIRLRVFFFSLLQTIRAIVKALTWS